MRCLSSWLIDLQGSRHLHRTSTTTTPTPTPPAQPTPASTPTTQTPTPTRCHRHCVHAIPHRGSACMLRPFGIQQFRNPRFRFCCRSVQSDPCSREPRHYPPSNCTPIRRLNWLRRMGVQFDGGWWLGSRGQGSLRTLPLQKRNRVFLNCWLPNGRSIQALPRCGIA